MGRRVIAVLAAMVVGLIGVAAVLLYASGADDRAVAGQQPATVFQARERVPAGTSVEDAVTKGLMVPTKIAAKGIPTGALAKVDASNRKLVALADIVQGEFVVASRFGTTPTGQKAIQVPDGMVAVSVSFDDQARVGMFVTPGSRIVIYDTYAPAATGNGSATGAKETRVLLDDVLVIAVGSTSLTPTGTPGTPAGQGQSAAAGALVTVALPPATATKLVHGIATGTLYAALRGTDAKPNAGEVVSDSTLFTK